MCDFNNLSSNENGFVLLCRQCGHYQIGFNGVLLSLEAEDFEKFYGLINYMAERAFPREKRQTRQIVVPTPYLGVNLLLCKYEIEQLQRLLAAAITQQEAQSILSLFSYN